MTDKQSAIEVEALKADSFGRIALMRDAQGLFVRRDLSASPWWLRFPAWRLARREARALQQLVGQAQTPQLLRWDGTFLDRSFMDGVAISRTGPVSTSVFATCPTFSELPNPSRRCPCGLHPWNVMIISCCNFCGSCFVSISMFKTCLSLYPCSKRNITLRFLFLLYSGISMSRNMVYPKRPLNFQDKIYAQSPVSIP